jgi:hypothetical protein
MVDISAWGFIGAAGDSNTFYMPRYNMYEIRTDHKPFKKTHSPLGCIRCDAIKFAFNEHGETAQKGDL